MYIYVCMLYEHMCIFLCTHMNRYCILEFLCVYYTKGNALVASVLAIFVFCVGVIV